MPTASRSRARAKTAALAVDPDTEHRDVGTPRPDDLHAQRPVASHVELDALDEEAAGALLTQEIDALLAAYERGGASLIIVSNEVGWGLVPPYPLGRVYRDVVGRAHQRLAAVADRVYLVVAGIPVELKAIRAALDETEGVMRET